MSRSQQQQSRTSSFQIVHVTQLKSGTENRRAVSKIARKSYTTTCSCRRHMPAHQWLAAAPLSTAALAQQPGPASSGLKATIRTCSKH
jgi:hypothetical protein